MKGLGPCSRGNKTYRFPGRRQHVAVTFTVNKADLQHILTQIVVAEREAACEALTGIIGPNAAILPIGLRHVDGTYNHLLPGNSN